MRWLQANRSRYSAREAVGLVENGWMMALALTVERRSELVALLDDQERLRAEFPKVAEYFEAAPTMSGTGRHEADGAFEVRLLHFMTAGRSAGLNPLWSIVEPSVSEKDGRRLVDGGNPNGSVKLSFAQFILQAAYAYAIPSPETIDWMVSFCGGQPIVELGAGRGYWAAQLADAGATVEAYDSEPPETASNDSFPSVPGQVDTWFPVADLDAYRSRLEAGEDFVLFLCWPPGWGNPMAADALTAFEEAGGQKVIYIGQPKGGMNGTDDFFDALTNRWRLQSEPQQHVTWWNLEEIAQGWAKQ